MSDNVGSTPSSEVERAGESSEVLESAIGAALQDWDEGTDEPVTASEPDEQPDEDDSKAEGDAEAPAEHETASAEEPEPEGEPTAEGEPEEPETLGAPSHWPADKQEAFGKLPREAQEFLLSEAKEQQADYTRKTQELAEQRKLAESFEQAIAPYRPMIQAEGGNDISAVQSLLNTAYMLRHGTPEQKTQLVRQMAQAYAPDALSVSDIEPGDGDYADPQLASIKQELGQLANQFDSFRGNLEQSHQQATLSVIDSFGTATDESGNLKHPHFEKVRARMGAEFATSNAVVSDVGKALEDAYQSAIWADPEIRQSLLEEQSKQRAAEVEAQRKAEVEKAKKAGRVPSSKTTTTQVTNPKTADDAINAALDKFWT